MGIQYFVDYRISQSHTLSQLRSRSIGSGYEEAHNRIYGAIAFAEEAGSSFAPCEV